MGLFGEVSRMLYGSRAQEFDPCFDPYADLTQWTGQISLDLQTRQTPRKGGESLLLSHISYVNRSS